MDRGVLTNLLILFVSMATFYAVSTLNVRAAAQGRYTISALTAFALAILGFVNIKLIASDTSTIISMIVYAIGGAVGDLLGIYISTQHLSASLDSTKEDWIL